MSFLLLWIVAVRRGNRKPGDRPTPCRRRGTTASTGPEGETRGRNRKYREYGTRPRRSRCRTSQHVHTQNLVDLRDRARDEIGKVVVGQDDAVDLLLVAALAQGHVLIEGPPGSAKTLLGRAMAHVLGAKFKRIQFTPDTTPDEITGVNTTKMGEQVFLPGVVFTNVLLADEINRTPPRTQAALLEAMQERTVTVDGRDAPAPRPVPRDRDAEPVRARGHLPAARVAARPLPLQDHPRLRRRRAARSRCSGSRTPA